ncbi:MAG: hypothetical protein J6S82_10870 [Bacteroidales bacterium]|nr:hypothetical protein [Bacteroidales bacterium]
MYSRTFQLFFLTSLFFIPAFPLHSQTVPDSLCEGSIYVKTDDYEGVIFGINCPENRKDDKAYRWNPTEEDIAKAEKLIKKYIVRSVEKKHYLPNQDGTPIVHQNFDKYYRQYLGYIDKRGRKILYVECFWKDKENLFPDWKRKKISVLDGGSYFWSIKINMKTNKCFDYSVNGNG